MRKGDEHGVGVCLSVVVVVMVSHQVPPGADRCHQVLIGDTRVSHGHILLMFANLSEIKIFLCERVRNVKLILCSIKCSVPI